MISKEAQELLYKFFDERKELIKQGGRDYITQLYTEFKSINADFAISLDSFRYRIQKYRQENAIKVASSKEQFKDAREAFIKLLDENQDLLTSKHWINAEQVKDFISANPRAETSNLRRWMHRYKAKD